ncbi:unnamed protein product, partial [Meganyctiphanes norvegica]
MATRSNQLQMMGLLFSYGGESIMKNCITKSEGSLRKYGGSHSLIYISILILDYLLSSNQHKTQTPHFLRHASSFRNSMTTPVKNILVSSVKSANSIGRVTPSGSSCCKKIVFISGTYGIKVNKIHDVQKQSINQVYIEKTSTTITHWYARLTERRNPEGFFNFNFIHPQLFDLKSRITTFTRLRGYNARISLYSYIYIGKNPPPRTACMEVISITLGLVGYRPNDRKYLLDMKVFVDTDSDERLVRRMRRDISERGRELDGVLKQYFKFVKPAFDYYIAPSMVHADIIVPRGGENEVAINLIAQNVMTQLQQRGFKIREKLLHANFGMSRPNSLHLLPTTPQIRGLHTFIRNKDTPRDEFIFYSKRLIRLVIEHALTMLPFTSVTVDTPQGVPYEGKRIATEKICGVSILRAGETMENALCEVLKDVRIGKILIQTNLDTGEPELYYLRLPKDIKDYHIFLMDATVATGAAAIMAIRVLLDHEVPEDNISLCSLLMTEQGVHNIAYAFPKVKIVTTAVDPCVNEKFYIVPGIGNFGDRYFGTEPSDQ